jgi:protein SCO1/2
MKPQHWAVVGLVAFVLSALLIAAIVRMRPPAGASAESFAEHRHTLEPLYSAPPFAYTDQHGATVTSLSIKGTPYIANFIFTTCRTICPLLTTKMVQLQRQLPGVNVRFVSFSVDPLHDTPQALADYARTWNPDEPRWTLLATDERTLPVTAAGFHVTAMKNASSSPEAELDPIIHSGVFLLVDGDGLVRGVYDSEDTDDFRTLATDARALAKAPPPTPTPPRDGATLYHQLSCANCHERPALAPPLGGILDTRRTLENSLLVTADRAYLKQSILSPEAKRVAGFPLKMPSYDGLLSASELDALVDFTISLPAPEGSADQAAVTLAIDPVCHMKVRVTDDALHAEHDGGTYYFCSEYCRERFTSTPAAFLKN